MSTDNIAHRDAIIGIVLRGWRNRAQSDLGALSFFFESFKRVIADFRLIYVSDLYTKRVAPLLNQQQDHP